MFVHVVFFAESEKRHVLGLRFLSERGGGLDGDALEVQEVVGPRGTLGASGVNLEVFGEGHVRRSVSCRGVG